MNYLDLPKRSEVKDVLGRIVLAFETGAEEIEFAGRTLRKQSSRRGTEFFVLEAGMPMVVRMYKSTTGRGHMITLDLDLQRTEDRGIDGSRTVNLRVRGHGKFDRSGAPNIFFFDPTSEGHRNGVVMTKLDLVERGLVNARDVFTEEELDMSAKARILSQEKADSLRARLACTE